MLKIPQDFQEKKCTPYPLFKRRKKKQDKSKLFIILTIKKCKPDHRYTNQVEYINKPPPPPPPQQKKDTYI
jgi:hypothetical protein